MQAAHDRLLDLCDPIYVKVRAVLGYEDEVVFVIYAGIGCSAGWVTIYSLDVDRNSSNRDGTLSKEDHCEWRSLARLRC